MRLCVRWLHVCAGKEKHTLRKSAFCARTLTEKRTLRADPHGKVHSARPPACRVRPLVRPTRKMRLSVRVTPQSASLRESPVAEWGTCARCCDAIRRNVNPHEPPKSQIKGIFAPLGDVEWHWGRALGDAEWQSGVCPPHWGRSSHTSGLQLPSRRVRRLVALAFVWVSG